MIQFLMKFPSGLWVRLPVEALFIRLLPALSVQRHKFKEKVLNLVQKYYIVIENCTFTNEITIYL